MTAVPKFADGDPVIFDTMKMKVVESQMCSCGCGFLYLLRGDQGSKAWSVSETVIIADMGPA